jgi:hypothetical protein
MTPPQLPSKPDVCLALLQSSNSIYVHLDPRKEEAHVPPWFKEQAQLVLQVGLNMAVPIPDLDVGPDALSCTLSFNRRAEFCHINWDCIYGIVGEDGRGMIWPESVPPEVAAAADGRPQQAPTSQRPSLRLAAEDGESLEESPAIEDSSSALNEGLKERIGLAASLDEEMSEEELQLPERVDTETIKKSAKETHPAQTGEFGPGETTATKSGRPIPSYLRVVK